MILLEEGGIETTWHRPSADYDNVAYANLVPPANIYPNLKFDNTTSCFVGSYVPLVAGNYSLSITHAPFRGDNGTHISGSPFFLGVNPDKTNGPASAVFGLMRPEEPLEMLTGGCHNFTIVAKDRNHNLREKGGDDFTVYMYRVEYYRGRRGVPRAGWEAGLPTAAPSMLYTTDTMPRSDAGQEVLRYGSIHDRGDGSYDGEICPVIAGEYEVHILLNGQGLSNQNLRVLDRTASYFEELALDNTFLGQYVNATPFHLHVSPSTPSAWTTTAFGQGLFRAVVGVNISFVVTVRDAWNNVCATDTDSTILDVTLLRSPESWVHIHDFKNGSYDVRYVADVTGDNQIAVLVNGSHIDGSPFTVDFVDGEASEEHTRALGAGLVSGATGQTSAFEVQVFDIEGNRKTHSRDIFSFYITGPEPHTNASETVQLLPCPKDEAAMDHIACDASDAWEGHFYGTFVPLLTGDFKVYVKLQRNSTMQMENIAGSPFPIRVYPSEPQAEHTDIFGSSLYDETAGIVGRVKVHLRDSHMNRLWKGEDRLELALIGVGVEYGTVEDGTSGRFPGPTPGLPSTHHYKGFYSGYPDVYANWVDVGDGSYLATYNAKKAGKYVMRIAVAQPGLNATYFNTTDLGTLVDMDFNHPQFEATLGGRAVNRWTTVSWTGDISARSYLHRYASRAENKIDFDFRPSVAQKFARYGRKQYHLKDTDRSELAIVMNVTDYLATFDEYDPASVRGLYDGQLPPKFREHYWSAVWTGFITAPVMEEFEFFLHLDSYSSAVLFIGGVGMAINGSHMGEVVLNVSTTNKASGIFDFTDVEPREFRLTYVHEAGPSHMKLMWRSPSTPLQVVPESAFSHWRNASHFNTTIHPAALSPIHSTAVGEALTAAVAGIRMSFVVYARDEFRNLLEKGGDVPTMVAVGPDGVAFRGEVTLTRTLNLTVTLTLTRTRTRTRTYSIR